MMGSNNPTHIDGVTNDMHHIKMQQSKALIDTEKKLHCILQHISTIAFNLVEWLK